jgi:DNA-directed RNA polymerase subunit G
MSEAKLSKLVLNCKIISILQGQLQSLSILQINCNNNKNGYLIEMDIPNEINMFNEGEVVNFILDTEKPNYSPKDFCAHGYLFYERKDKEEYINLISLYGLLVKIISKEGLINSKKFKMMDHVYLCVKRS